jgi:hypothetical protein
MNQSIRPTIFEFIKSPKPFNITPLRITPRIRYKSNLSSLNFSKNYEEHARKDQSLKKISDKNFGLSFTQRDGNNFSICQVQEMPKKKHSPRTLRIVKKTVRNKYFNETRLKKIGFSLKNNSNLAVNSTANTTNSSLKNIIQEIWKEPSAVIEKRRQQFSLHAKLRRTLHKDSRSFDAASKEPVGLVPNCVCIQTDDLDILTSEGQDM